MKSIALIIACIFISINLHAQNETRIFEDRDSRNKGLVKGNDTLVPAIYDQIFIMKNGFLLVEEPVKTKKKSKIHKVKWVDENNNLLRSFDNTVESTSNLIIEYKDEFYSIFSFSQNKIVVDNCEAYNWLNDYKYVSYQKDNESGLLLGNGESVFKVNNEVPIKYYGNYGIFTAGNKELELFTMKGDKIIGKVKKIVPIKLYNFNNYICYLANGKQSLLINNNVLE